MEKLCLSVVITAILAFALTTGEKTNVLEVTRRLENGEPIPKEKWTRIELICSNYGGLTLTVKRPDRKSAVRVYLANEIKNILDLDLRGPTLNGHIYETPYGKMKTVEGPKLSKEDGGKTIVAKIPRSWVPKNCTRLSASVKVLDDIYNYYGIFNTELSIEDKLVVENFKRVELCGDDM